MTSNDRHASHDSPYRTGSHVPLSQHKHAPLSTAPTNAMESQSDLRLQDNESGNAVWTAPGSPSLRSPTVPYSPGLRSQMTRRGSNDAADPISPGEIQMQNFQEGLPPAPPVSHSWKRIDRWAEDNYPELYDQLSEGCTQNDINELEHELDCSLPIEVRESIQCHDGQERGGRPTGILFSCMLLDCEEIVQEWRNWQVVNEEYLSTNHSSVSINMSSSKSVAGPSSSGTPSVSGSLATSTGPNPLWRQELMERQDSQPARAIQRAYAHAGWIPLARDWGGNNIAIDLAPGPTGKWGQVILFGRDYDCKYVVARSWAAFMAQLADDFGSDKPYVDEDSQELRLREFRQQNVEPSYMEILRWRCDQKHGRRLPKKQRMPPNGQPPAHARGSPYGSPTSDRGRSPDRPGNGKAPAAAIGSPRSHPARVSSPLTRVAGAGAIAVPKPINPRKLADASKLGVSVSAPAARPEKLVEAPTPRLVGDGIMERKLAAAMGDAVNLVDGQAPSAGGAGEEGEEGGKVAGLGVSVLQDKMNDVAL